MALKYHKVFEITRDLAESDRKKFGLPVYLANAGLSLYRSTSSDLTAEQARTVIPRFASADHRWSGAVPSGSAGAKPGHGGLYVSLAPAALFNEGIYYAHRNAAVELLEGSQPNLYDERQAKQFLELHNRPGNVRVAEQDPTNILSRSYAAEKPGKYQLDFVPTRPAQIIYEYELGAAKWTADLTPIGNQFLSRLYDKIVGYSEVTNMLEREGFRDLYSYNLHSDDYSVTKALGDVALSVSDLDGLLVRGARNYLKPGNNLVFSGETGEGDITSLRPQRRITIEEGSGGFDVFQVEEISDETGNPSLTAETTD